MSDYKVKLFGLWVHTKTRKYIDRLGYNGLQSIFNSPVNDYISTVRCKDIVECGRQLDENEVPYWFEWKTVETLSYKSHPQKEESHSYYYVSARLCFGSQRDMVAYRIIHPLDEGGVLDINDGHLILHN